MPRFPWYVWVLLTLLVFAAAEAVIQFLHGWAYVGGVAGLFLVWLLLRVRRPAG